MKDAVLIAAGVGGVDGCDATDATTQRRFRMTNSDGSEPQEVAARALEVAENVLGMSYASALELFEGNGGIQMDGVLFDDPKTRVILRLGTRIASVVSSVNVIKIHLDNVKRMQRRES